MIQKQSLVIPSDKSGVWLARTIHTYTKISRIASVSAFGKLSAREVSVRSWLRKKKKKKFLYTRSSVIHTRPCGLYILSHKGVLSLKKRLTPIGRRVAGFIHLEVNRKRAISSFVTIL